MRNKKQQVSTTASKALRPLLLAAVLFFSVATQAQRDDFIGRSELLLSAGGMNYIGDLNNQSVFGQPHTAASAGLRCRLDNRWALRIEAAGGLLESGDYIERRNLSFRSNLYEVSALAEFNFWNYGYGNTDKSFVFYLYSGVTAFHFNPMAHYVLADGTESWAALQPLHTEGQGSVEYPDRRPYPLTEVAMPLGVGFKSRIGKSLSFSIEYGFRMTLTDYIDDVSTTYVGSDLLIGNCADGELAAQLADRSSEVVPGYVNAPGIKRGDDSLNDMYAYLHISLGLKLETILGWTRSKRCKL